jgi:WD40 repeat protein
MDIRCVSFTVLNYGEEWETAMNCSYTLMQMLGGALLIVAVVPVVILPPLVADDPVRGRQDQPLQEGLSPLAALHPARIPVHERFAWQPPELVALLGSHHGHHWGAVNAVAYSPDGKLVASGGNDHVVRLWNAQTRRQVGVLRGHQDTIFAVAFSPVGNTLASASADKTVRLWDITANTPKLRQVLQGHEDEVFSVAFAVDGKMLASGDNHGVVLMWDFDGERAQLRTKLPPKVPHGEYRRQAVAFSRDGTMATSSNLEVVLWNLRGTRPEIIRTLKAMGELDRVQSLAFSPDGKTLAAGRYDGGGTHLWDLTGDLQKEMCWLDGGTTWNVAFSPNSKMLVSVVSAPEVLLWEVSGKTPSLRSKLVGEKYGAGAAAFSPDGKTLVSGSQAGALRFWDLTGQEPKAKLPLRGHDDEVRAVVLSPDGRILASSSYDATLRIWDLGADQPKPRVTFSAESDHALSLAFSPDSKRLISENWHGTLRLWDVSGTKPWLLKEFGEEGSRREEVWALTVSPDGRTVAAGGRSLDIRLWDLTGEGSIDFKALKGHGHYAIALAYSRDGKTLASGSYDGTLRLWDLTDSKAPKNHVTLDAHKNSKGRKTVVQAVAFAPDGKTLLSGGGDGVVRCWDLTGAYPKERSSIRLDKGPVGSIDVSPDGSKLVVAYRRGYILLSNWSGNKLRDWQLEGAADNRFAMDGEVRFTADGKHLLSVNSNATAYILRLSH